MSNLGSNIDKLFKEGLGDAKVNPPSSVFNSIQGNLNPQITQTVSKGSKIAAKLAGVTGVKVAVVATVVSVTAASIVWFNQSNLDKTIVIDSVQNENKIKIEKELISPKTTSSNVEVDFTSKDSIEEPTKYTRNNSQLLIGEPNIIDAVVEEKVDVENNYIEDTSEYFVANPIKEGQIPVQQITTSVNCGLLGVELMVEDQTAILNFVNVAKNNENIPVEIDWGDLDFNKFVLENQLEVKHKFYVLNSKEFTVSISAKGKKCDQKIERKVFILNNSIQQDIVVPNIFTPNNDGINDSFYAEMPATKEFLMRVIGPTKQIVYESNNYKGKWGGDFRGRQCEKGIYTVILKYKYSGDTEWKSKTSTVWLNRN